MLYKLQRLLEILNKKLLRGDKMKIKLDRVDMLILGIILLIIGILL